MSMSTPFSVVSRIRRFESAGIVAALIAMCAALALFTSTFASAYNLAVVMRQASFVGVIALGQTLVLLTGGIDVHAKREIQRLLRNLTGSRISAIYISSELKELLDVCDRVMLMHEGRVRGTVDAEGATQESLLAIAIS